MCVGWYITIAARSLSPTADSKNSTLVQVSYYVPYQLTGVEMCRHISTFIVHCKYRCHAVVTSVTSQSASSTMIIKECVPRAGYFDPITTLKESH